MNYILIKSFYCMRIIFYAVTLFYSINVFSKDSNAERNYKPNECVVLIHGFLRSSSQLKKIGDYFLKYGYSVHYVDYISRVNQIVKISDTYVLPIVRLNCGNYDKIHFVTHSAGGVIVRYFLGKHHLKNLGRVVMLAPPNRGSEVADLLSQFSFVNYLLGPMLKELGTDKISFVNSLGLPNFEYSVIMGNSTLDPISSLIIPGDDDGRVSVDKSKLANMKDFLLVNKTHTFLMDATEVQEASLNFIRTGKFLKSE
ncbi:alpha/beta hydrolase family protein [Leptospira weilii str. UI 13098]|uniref:Alpha/beta hydrolase family protein n=2 Tax=Leptospira weilii TaxID=28184 RepID=M6Q895_9LEPT|nr:alpha/beta hydrolase family protein [Leptospira weilii str. LNT 1234]EMN91861.1 alpha/beta hydrolase family protein [Leptospira weilii str. UI 13098]